MIDYDTMDGNEAAAFSSYFFTDVAAIFPITPSSPMAEHVDEWSAHGRKNLFDQTVRVVQLQSEAGAAGTMHGSLAAGALTATYTASQGLLLMIPNIYKMVGELLPGVLHVSARALATHALSIFGDHQDVMACRQTGAIMIASANAQEAMDLGATAHLAAIKARLPVIHFFDGFRTSHEYQKVALISREQAEKLIDFKLIDEFRDRGLSPEHPVVRGTAQNPDIYFQGREVQNKYFNAVPDILSGLLYEFKNVTGREYHLYDYYGEPDAERIIIAMGSVCDTAEETVDFLNNKGEKIGVVKVHLYRPFSAENLLNIIPKTVKKIAVLDRTKEPGAAGEPLYLDVVEAFSGQEKKPVIVGGRYGLGSKDTTPSKLISVFENLKQENPKNKFTIGIVDDVTGTSLPAGSSELNVSKDAVNCKLYGLGSDGTVGANKSAIKIIGNNTDLYVQGYFEYDSKKSGGTTISHLRFGKSPIKSHYLVYEADYIACHNKSFIYHLDILNGIKEKGIFVLNCDWDQDELEEHLPAAMKKTIAEKNIDFYIIDATTAAREIGLGNRINMIMQAAFMKLVNIIPIDDSVKLLKQSIAETYGRKGQKIVDLNSTAVDAGINSLVRINPPSFWKEIVLEEDKDSEDENSFFNRIQRKMAKHEGDNLPVSAFEGMEDGSFPLGTTAFEKRVIAVMVPQWQKDKCIECGMCSFVCPHATIRMFLLDEQEQKNAPESFELKKAGGKKFGDYGFRVQVSPLDCTGCGVCADVCPVKEKALIMEPAEQEIEAQADNWEFAMTVTEKSDVMPKSNIFGSQLARPLLEFNGACPGCGETPYIRLLTQLFGDRMMIANATGCSSIWGASAPSIPYTTNHEGRGPAWGNSLFEDNAEYGYGMSLAVEQIRKKLTDLIRDALETQIPQNLKDALQDWLDNKNDAAGSRKAAMMIIDIIEKNERKNGLMQQILKYKDFLVKRSFWIIGGDGWAYDIDYGGVDHVLSTGKDINLFVLDTEIYSNTGGQSSKATPASAVAKFAAKGKDTRKKDLGMMAMSYENVYVAQIAMGANMNQTLKAMIEAESYKGPSLIIAYAPCISHGIKTGMGTSILQEKRAVDAGYWHLYRYNPELKKQGKNPFILDSKDPKTPYSEFLKSELRYSQLANVFPDTAEDMYKLSEKYAKERLESYKRLEAKS